MGGETIGTRLGVSMARSQFRCVVIRSVAMLVLEGSSQLGRQVAGDGLGTEPKLACPATPMLLHQECWPLFHIEAGLAATRPEGFVAGQKLFSYVGHCGAARVALMGLGSLKIVSDAEYVAGDESAA